ncbi:hypothetical protein ASE67_01500 [Sphingomonas sp. Leaf23]|uniref:hypothetical protein n=1 Tax=Sphingomonas sp. Leaf23 TaxID=1735689 RepID=UPI0006F67E8B|nr:hypothetical protein [Sphingomonas sp. Leaf23]KQM88461.1 hypothetical protein ASE67_01500 [Sphingomonas sp. Leaf23]
MVAVYAPDAAFAGSVLPRDIYLTTNRAGLVGEYLFGQDLIQSRENSATPNATLATEVLTGAAVPPVYGDHRVELGNGAGLATGLIGMPVQTILLFAAVAGSDAPDLTQVPTPKHIFHGATVAEAGRLTMTTSVINGVLSIGATPNGNASDARFTPAAPFTAIRGIASRIFGLLAGSRITMDEYKGGALINHAEAVLSADRPNPTYGIVVGNSNAVAAGGDFRERVQHAMCLIWSRYLTDAELLAAYLEARANLASMGVAA